MALPPLTPESGAVEVDGCDVRWYAAGAGEPTLLLIHGGGGHAGWWEPVLNGLSARQRVVALDLSGHGDSGRRPHGYPTTTWAKEVALVIDAVVGGRAVIVGHSLGGRIGAMAAGRHGRQVEALVTLDAVVPRHPGEPNPTPRSAKVYSSEAKILDAFRLMPPQPEPGPAIMRRLARRSITRCEGGWTWKFDPAIFGHVNDPIVDRDLPRICCPITVIRGAESAVTRPEMTAELARRVGREVTQIALAGALHHVQLDAPGALDRLLAELPDTRPRALPARSDGAPLALGSRNAL